MKKDWIERHIDSFRLKINHQNRRVQVIDAMQEGRLSHLSFIPGSKRFSTFLVDIGNGNTKGGFSPTTIPGISG